MSWNPETPGLTVRMKSNPGRRGTTTGRVKPIGSFILVEIDFGPNEKQFKHFDLLEPVAHDKPGMFDLLRSGRFGGPIDLRRLLTFEKVKGELTNVFYSMEASNTDYYSHQFKPVLKFIESPVGRLLIADEVGLGKTIESIYIWKELQARHDARRLLVVCPAMLRDKWQSDLKNRFNISAEIVNSKRLFQSLFDIAERGISRDFNFIISLESMRPPRKFKDMDNMSIRAELARLLYHNTASEEFSLFDLVIMDEAHYLRTPGSRSNDLGQLLRESAQHLVLLTATPIQIHSDNLYQLLRLIDPDQFYDKSLFSEMLQANSPVVNALRFLWRHPPELERVAESIKTALSSIYFKDDVVLNRISDQVENLESDPEKRVELARMLEARSLLGHYMVRSRKREVLKRTVERKAQVLQVDFCPVERAIYDRITNWIKSHTSDNFDATTLSLIMRQRQMASSLVAALKSWNETGYFAEMLWGDLGNSVDLDEKLVDHEVSDSKTLEDFWQDLDPNEFVEDSDRPLDLKFLEESDSKYTELRKFLHDQLEENSSEKFVVFAYFRGTLQYLKHRLVQDNIPSVLIMGGMGDEKKEILQSFSEPGGPSVLLSSEVGSEGIDLQFCRFLVNYDLPWNPMKVEQRIGRLDRLGQQAERIVIVNLVVNDTVEDRILYRLYERISLFETTIGNLEEILGEMTSHLILELLQPSLNEEDREKKAEEVALAILNRKQQQDDMEQKAINLIGFTDYILEHISDSRDKGRWLSSTDLMSLVDDFFARKYPGTKIKPDSKHPSGTKVQLSIKARENLGIFVANKKLPKRTRLHQTGKPIVCLFDPREVKTFERNVELIDPTHPLVQWIRADYEKDDHQLYQVSAIRLDAARAAVPSGDYVFVVHRWSFIGLRKDRMLAFRAVRIRDSKHIDDQASEQLVTAAAKHGQTFPNAENVIGDFQEVLSRAQDCETMLNEAFKEKFSNIQTENHLRCDQQETSVKNFEQRRVGELKSRLARYREEGKTKPIPGTEGLLRKEENAVQIKFDRIKQRRLVDPTLIQLATGVVRVE